MHASNGRGVCRAVKLSLQGRRAVGLILWVVVSPKRALPCRTVHHHALLIRVLLVVTHNTLALLWYSRKLHIL